MSAEQPKVIHGYVTPGEKRDRHGMWLFRDRVTKTPAQLVLTSEPLYTESQVRAMVEEIFERGQYHGFTKDTVLDIEQTAAKHGLKL